jgi:hypothetical protein
LLAYEPNLFSIGLRQTNWMSKVDVTYFLNKVKKGGVDFWFHCCEILKLTWSPRTGAIHVSRLRDPCKARAEGIRLRLIKHPILGLYLVTRVIPK